MSFFFLRSLRVANVLLRAALLPCDRKCKPPRFLLRRQFFRLANETLLKEGNLCYFVCDMCILNQLKFYHKKPYVGVLISFRLPQNDECSYANYDARRTASSVWNGFERSPGYHEIVQLQGAC